MHIYGVISCFNQACLAAYILNRAVSVTIKCPYMETGVISWKVAKNAITAVSRNVCLRVYRFAQVKDRQTHTRKEISNPVT